MFSDMASFATGCQHFEGNQNEGEISMSKIKKGLIATAMAAPFAVGGVAVVQEVRPRDFIVLSEHGHVGDAATALGDVTRGVDGLPAVVVRASRHKVRGNAARPGIIVEEVSRDFRAIEEVTVKVSCSGGCAPCPTPTPGPTPVPIPQPTPGPGDQIIDWGVAAMGTVPHFATNDAKGVTVCAADTGATMNHPDLKISSGANFTGGDRNDFTDRQGHGSHCLGAIGAANNATGVVGASQARLIAAKVLGDDGSGSNESIASGIMWCVQQNANVISLSLGGPYPSQVLEYALRQATGKGILVFAAAGNDSTSRPSYPAGYRMPNLFSVSAIDKSGQLARFSNYGKVDATAPGVETLSTVPGGYKRMSGTSMATPLCAGVAAMYLARGKKPYFKPHGDPTKFGQGLCSGEQL